MLQRKLMEVLAFRAQKRDRPMACPASVYAREDSNLQPPVPKTDSPSGRIDFAGFAVQTRVGSSGKAGR